MTVNGQRSTVAVTRADLSLMSLGLTWQQTRNARGGAGARGRIAGEPETSNGTWGSMRGWIRPILVAMDRS